MGNTRCMDTATCNNKRRLFYFRYVKGLSLMALVFLIPLSIARAMPLDWKQAESSHFIVYYKNAGEDFIRDVLRHSERSYDMICRNLGLTQDNQREQSTPVKIYIFDTKAQYQADTGQPPWSDGSSIQRLRVMYSFVGAKKFLDAALPHELAHIMFREAVGFGNRGIPLWFEEGVASFQENKDLAGLGRFLQSVREKGGLISLPELSNVALRSLDDRSQIDLFYAESLSAVQYLITEFGADMFRIFFQSLRKEKDFDKALDKAYGFKNLKDLDNGWKMYLKKNLSGFQYRRLVVKS